MKKALIFTMVFFLLIGMTSCKKLLGLDAESLLTREPWIGDKTELYKNGIFQNSHDIRDWTIEIIKKNHRYVTYHYGIINEKGVWAYDKKRKLLTFDSDLNVAYVYKIIKLNKENLIYEHTINDSGEEVTFKWYLNH